MDAEVGLLLVGFALLLVLLLLLTGTPRAMGLRTSPGAAPAAGFAVVVEISVMTFKLQLPFSIRSRLRRFCR